jgi:hypothetical protein
MSRWYRVFGRSEAQPSAGVLLEHVRGLGVTGGAHFQGDDDGWTVLELTLAEGFTPLRVECFLSSEPDIRGELSAWAAELETCDYSPHSAMLMERVIQTRQVYAMRRPIDHADEVRLENTCEAISKFLATATDGVWQADGRGFFTPEGELLLQEY